jgi:hypothetical protein
MALPATHPELLATRGTVARQADGTNTFLVPHVPLQIYFITPVYGREACRCKAAVSDGYS